MIKVGDKIYRNLEEQVQYLTDYHYVNQGLVQWGIRVIGQVETADELPLPYDGEYGDAIAVGTQAPFFFYIWTRASIEGSPAYWFPFGEISTVGPEGPVGPAGPQGPRGEATRWYIGSSVPRNSGAYRSGDMYLQSNGQVYMFTDGAWVSHTSIMGPQGPQGIQGPRGEQGPAGPQGIQGERGDVGGFINVYGILNSTSELPLPSTLNNLTAAYLVGSSAPYDLYVQVGQTSEVATWNNTGPFNAATLVMVGGLAQNVWDADTKLDKNTTFDSKTMAYVKYPTGAQGSKEVAGRATPGTIVERTATGQVLIAQEPTDAGSATSKAYVDKKFAPSSPIETINWTDRNPHATALDSSLTGSITTGAKNTYATVLNKQTTAMNANSLAIGNKCIAKGDESIAGGYQSVTLDSSAVAIGEQVVAAANSSVAFGNSTQALGDHSMAIGYDTIANSPCSFAGGNTSKASAENSIAFGSNCRTFGPHSVALGNDSFTSLNAYAGLAAGLGIKSSSEYQAAVGRYNEAISGNIFEVGNGSDADHRETIFAVTRDGRAKADTIPTDNNDLTNKYYVDNKIKATFTLDGNTLLITTTD